MSFVPYTIEFQTRPLCLGNPVTQNGSRLKLLSIEWMLLKKNTFKPASKFFYFKTMMSAISSLIVKINFFIEWKSILTVILSQFLHQDKCRKPLSS